MTKNALLLLLIHPKYVYSVDEAYLDNFSCIYDSYTVINIGFGQVDDEIIRSKLSKMGVQESSKRF